MGIGLYMYVYWGSGCVTIVLLSTGLRVILSRPNIVGICLLYSFYDPPRALAYKEYLGLDKKINTTT